MKKLLILFFVASLCACGGQTSNNVKENDSVSVDSVSVDSLIIETNITEQQ